MDIKFLQSAINKMPGYPIKVDGKSEYLVVDGLSGNKTQTAIDGITRNTWNSKLQIWQTVESKGLINILKDTFKSLGWIWDNAFNFIAIRMDDIYTNKFTDIMFVYAMGNISAYPCSTKPGTTAVKENATMWVSGLRGVGCLKENQYLKTFRIYRPDKWFWSGGLPFLYQEKQVECIRDPNGDGKLDRNFTQWGLFGINIHSWKGWVYQFLSYWTSSGKGVAITTACQVTDETTWNILFPILEKYNPDDLLTYNLLNINQIKT